MKEKIREFIFKLFQKQIMGICKPLLPEATIIRFQETKFDWVKISAKVQVNQIYTDLRDQLIAKREIERQILQQLTVEISKKIEIKSWDTGNPANITFTAHIYIANEPKY